MGRLRVWLREKGHDIKDAVTLEALDMATALTVVEINLDHGQAEIWDGNHRLARLNRLGRSGTTFWRIG